MNGPKRDYASTLENDAAPNVTVLGTNKYGLVFQERQAVGEATRNQRGFLGLMENLSILN